MLTMFTKCRVSSNGLITLNLYERNKLNILKTKQLPTLSNNLLLQIMLIRF